jgi:hypothetical protein
VRDLAELVGEQVTDRGDARLPAVDEPRARDLIRACLRSSDHRPGVIDAWRERLLTEDVLAGSQQTLHDGTVQLVRHDDADDVHGIVVSRSCQSVSVRSFPYRVAASLATASFASTADTYRTGGSGGSNSVGAVR